jgi:hypothetical protein
MSRDAIRVLSAISLAVLACGGEPESSAPGAASGEPAAIGGRWAVEGETIEPGNDASRRRITGTVKLDQAGDRYTSSFEMDTMIPTPEGASLSTHVIGTGAGTIAGNRISGEARTQLVMAGVPGVDPDFAFVPRTTTVRIVSAVSGEAQADGTIVLNIESKGEAGEDYRPTRTTLRGRRVASGAAEPPSE